MTRVKAYKSNFLKANASELDPMPRKRKKDIQCVQWTFPATTTPSLHHQDHHGSSLALCSNTYLCMA